MSGSLPIERCGRARCVACTALACCEHAVLAFADQVSVERRRIRLVVAARRQHNLTVLVEGALKCRSYFWKPCQQPSWKERDGACEQVGHSGAAFATEAVALMVVTVATFTWSRSDMPSSRAGAECSRKRGGALSNRRWLRDSVCAPGFGLSLP